MYEQVAETVEDVIQDYPVYGAILHYHDGINARKVFDAKGEKLQEILISLGLRHGRFAWDRYVETEDENGEIVKERVKEDFIVHDTRRAPEDRALTATRDEKRQIQALRDDLDEHRDANDRLKRELRRVKAEAEELREMLETRVTGYQAKMDALEDRYAIRLSTAEDRYRGLQDEFDTLHRRHVQLQSDHAMIQLQARKEAESGLEALKARIAELERERDAFKLQVMERDAESRALEKFGPRDDDDEPQPSTTDKLIERLAPYAETLLPVLAQRFMPAAPALAGAPMGDGMPAQAAVQAAPQTAPETDTALADLPEADAAQHAEMTQNALNQLAAILERGLKATSPKAAQTEAAQIGQTIETLVQLRYANWQNLAIWALQTAQANAARPPVVAALVAPLLQRMPAVQMALPYMPTAGAVEMLAKMSPTPLSPEARTFLSGVIDALKHGATPTA